MRNSLFSIALMATCASVAALPARAEERTVGSVSGWQVSLITNGGRFMGCAAVHNRLDGATAIGMDGGGNWLLAFDMRGPNGVLPAQLNIDGRVWYFSISSDGTKVSFGPSLQIMNAVRAGNNLTVSVNGQSFHTDLVGSSAAMSMVQNCVQTAGD
ncbi:MAG: hypothetical protein H6899_17170 [Rhodobacter sp.]|nr:hypothetical protein [Paracoccaceae bacterium]MCC0081637.1 hypothetical protein [Rhodobacter sp.]